MIKTVPNILKYLCLNENATNVSRRLISTTTALKDVERHRVDDRKLMLKSLPAVDEGTAGEKTADLDSMLVSKGEIFPTIGYLKKTFNGVPFTEIPIVNIKVSHNNTILNLTDIKGNPQMIRSCGMEGFKHTRKGTNIAAQATAITLGTKILERGIKMVRVKVRGLGPGRMSSIKGLQMAGLNIVSITDYTRVSWNPPRPRKARKL